jgi:hypothetical protein
MNMVQQMAYLINDIHWFYLIAKVEANSKTEWRSFYDLILNHVHFVNGSYSLNTPQLLNTIQFLARF